MTLFDPLPEPPHLHREELLKTCFADLGRLTKKGVSWEILRTVKYVQQLKGESALQNMLYTGLHVTSVQTASNFTTEKRTDHAIIGSWNT